MGARILYKEELAPKVMKFIIESPTIARQTKPGQFLILRVHKDGERIPLSIPATDPEKGTVMLVSQEVGKTTAMLNDLEVGDEIYDVVGPLGRPTHIEKFGTTLAIGGGVGIAPLYPIVKELKKAGNYVVSILGGRSKEFVIMENEMRSVSDKVFICTDDGSYGEKGFVSHVLQHLLKDGREFDFCITIGPPIMMKVICDITRPYGIKTYVSLNTIMVDGTGMCGACRVSVGDKTKFVCVDGPEFDGHQVNFDEMMKRLAMYRKQEELAYKAYLEKRKEMSRH
ncbi:sulfide/dihydroorotate dehydrogenase-like FAD/NAD-binding protein [Candidatus Sumerlaeota bacterium]|nr:sulfide/dihydroorotate dehydrogenase-like FAD/NAD-binding protein [Candidatus Sumerlaeota bacterium]